MPNIINGYPMVEPTSLEPQSGQTKRLKEATEEFEALFLKNMLSAMRQTIMESGLFKKDSGMKMYEDMLYEYLAKEIARSGGVGISEVLFKELSEQMAKGGERG